MIDFVNEITVWLDQLEEQGVDVSLCRILTEYNYLLNFISSINNTEYIEDFFDLEITNGCGYYCGYYSSTIDYIKKTSYWGGGYDTEEVTYDVAHGNGFHVYNKINEYLYDNLSNQ